MNFTPDQVARATSSRNSTVALHWPLICEALDEQGIGSPLVEVAAAATVVTEVPHFAPIVEYGPESYFKKYEFRTDLGNLTPGDGFKFRGRGFIQLTGRANYERYGKALDLDLMTYPSLALEPGASARILALYFKTMRVDKAAEAQNWEKVRKLVNGGLNGFDTFQRAVNALLLVACEPPKEFV